MNRFDDRRLVRRLLAGDELAFHQLFDRAFPALCRFAAARLPDPEAAEEVAQQTLCIAMRKLGQWRGEAALATWLFTIARHEIGARLRASREAAVELREDVPEIRAALESLAADLDGPEAEARRRELARRVRVILDSLPARYGDVLTWKYLEELPVAVIANRLGVGLKAAESTLTRARAAFRDGFSALASEVGR